MSMLGPETSKIPRQDSPLEAPPIGFANFDKRIRALMARDCGKCVTAREVWLDDKGLMLELRTAGDIHQALARLEELTPCTHGNTDDILTTVEGISGVRVSPLPETQDHNDIIASIEALKTRYNSTNAPA